MLLNRNIPSYVYSFILLTAFSVQMAATQNTSGDELPPSLEMEIGDPRIPVIVDATIQKFNAAGHAQIKVNTVYKPMPGGGVEVPSIVRGYVASKAGGVEKIATMKLLTNRGTTRFLLFLDGDLLFSTYNNRFEIRKENDQLVVNTGRAWRPLKDIVGLIPRANSPSQRVASARSPEKKLEASLANWKKARADSHGNYSYHVRFTSFVGSGNETEIVVRNHKVAERRYRTFSERAILQDEEKPDRGQWFEKGDKVGSHKEGAPAKTLDQLYVEACKVIGTDRLANEKLYVRFDKQGLLLNCFTVDTRIADDAPRNGVSIFSVTLGTGGKVGKDLKKPVQVYKAPNGKPFPAGWGGPPRRQTRDLRPLSGGYGRGSGTLARWIQENLDRDAAKKENK